MSISISVVDQTVKCSQCSQTFRNSNVLAEHTKSVHLARFASLGLSITAPGEKKTGLPESAALAQSPGITKLTLIQILQSLNIQDRTSDPGRPVML